MTDTTTQAERSDDAQRRSAVPCSTKLQIDGVVMQNGWYKTSTLKPALYPIEGTECAISDPVLCLLDYGDGETEFEVGQYFRGMKGDCETLYWGLGGEPEWWRPIVGPFGA